MKEKKNGDIKNEYYAVLHHIINIELFLYLLENIIFYYRQWLGQKKR